MDIEQTLLATARTPYNDRRGATMLEYTLMAGVMAAAILLGYASFANVASSFFVSMGNLIDAPPSGS